MAEIRIFSQPSCPACNEAKEYLKSKSIPYTDYNILEDDKALDEMLNVHKVRVTPLIIVGDKKLIGFDVEELDRALAESK